MTVKVLNLKNRRTLYPARLNNFSYSSYDLSFPPNSENVLHVIALAMSARADCPSGIYSDGADVEEAGAMTGLATKTSLMIILDPAV
jgi:hypothetical protein